MTKLVHFVHAVMAALALAAPVAAQTSADADLAPVPASEAGYGTTTPPSPQPVGSPPPAATSPAAPSPAPAVQAAPTPTQTATYDQQTVITAAEDVFGRGAEGLAKMIETIFKDMGEPNGYIAGREGSGAIGLGLRYGNGTLHHKVEGEMPVHWTGPSLGFDVGGDANKVFTLVYNLHDTAELYRRYPSVEGKAYLIGGLTANYLQRGDVVIVPIKLGVGWRLGANIGYLSFSREGTVVPF